MSLRVVVRSPADLLGNALFIAWDSPVAAQRFLDEARRCSTRSAWSQARFPQLVNPCGVMAVR
jgi:hypothetical protein